MIKKWLNDIEEGRALWLAECREEMNEDTDAVKTSISVISDEGKQLSFDINLPKVDTQEEINLMYAYLDANRHNAAMLLGQNDDADCKMPDTDAIVSKIRAGAEKTDYLMPSEPLVCGLDVSLNDMKLVLAEGSRIRRILSYDWNPSIATEAAMISNPIYELIEMAANGMKLDGIGLAVPEFKFDLDFKEILKPLIKENAPIKILSIGAMAAFSVYNELRASEAGDKITNDGLIAFRLGADIDFGYVREDGSLAGIPGALSKCLFRIDSEEDSKFLNQERFLKAANMPNTNPKPCIDMLFNMAEAGEKNAETLFMNLGQYLGHAIRETEFFVKPKTHKYFLMGSLCENEYAFDLMCIALQRIAPDADVLQVDASIANTEILKAIKEISDEAAVQFAVAVGCIYYVFIDHL